ncbi:KTSC domain-containing protein [Lysobacter arvi]|uniref:KTSC domain-containing protein n=1 Tax=Lysobacter arvi TaxID=3038776 RepID=A0ABU1CDK5_9GAMM|nr:KTSC domain-containing protein [Lysobacter arvi]MDR0182240.1 KTSC domain-containing protein [Lysobacter arvi]
MRSVGYDADVRVLEIEFVSGDVYQYFDVPPHLHAGLMGATSHGQFFAEHLRNAGFDYEQVDEDEAPRTR